jgi:SAM-dependent methyltransferase
MQETTMMPEMWEQRYAEPEYAYGEDPNAFFKATLDEIPKAGRILLPAEGEGRNAVYAARQGWTVRAFDFSAAGRDKALRLAARHGVRLDHEVADFRTARIEDGVYDVVALIFAHIHEAERRAIHRRLESALAPGGLLILEAYGKDQLGRGTGGPRAKELLYTVADLREDFSGLDIVRLEQVEAEIREGRYHHGLASIIRLLARRPQVSAARSG